MSKSTILNENAESAAEASPSKSLSKENTKTGKTSGPSKFFGTLSSLPSFSYLTGTHSLSDTCKKLPNSPSGQAHSSCPLKETHGIKSSNTLDGLAVVKQTSLPGTEDNSRSTNSEDSNQHLSPAASSTAKWKYGESGLQSYHDILRLRTNTNQTRAAIVESWIRNIQQSINLIKAKNASLFDEEEKIELMDPEMQMDKTPVPREDAVSSQEPMTNLSSDRFTVPDNVRRVIVCDPNCLSVPKVIMCEKNCEAVALSCDDNSDISPTASQSFIDGNANQEMAWHPAESGTIEPDPNQEPVYFETSDRSCTSVNQDPPNNFQPRTQLSGGADDMTTPSNTNETLGTSTNDLKESVKNPENVSNLRHSHHSLGSEKSSLYEPAGHVHTCCLASVLNDHELSSEGLTQPSLPDPTCACLCSCHLAGGACGHGALVQRSVTPLREMFDAQEPKVEEECEKAKACQHVCENCVLKTTSHENSESILKSISQKYNETKNSIKLTALEKENDKLANELRQKEFRINQLKKKVEGLECEKDCKPAEDGASTPCINRDEKLQELANTISAIQRNIEVYCSCLKGDHCNLELQIHEMESAVGKIKKDLDTLKNERLEKEAGQKAGQDSNQSKDQISESSLKGGADSGKRFSLQFCSKLPMLQSGCLNPRLQDGLCSQLEKTLSKAMKCSSADLHADLNKNICDLQTKVSMLKTQLDRQRCCKKIVQGSGSELQNCSACNCGCCYSATDQARSSVDSGGTACCVEELQKLTDGEVCQLVQVLRCANAVQTDLARELELCLCQIAELKQDLQDTELKVSKLQAELAIKSNKVSELENLRAGSSIYEQNPDSKVKDLEERLACCENAVGSRENIIKDLEENLKLCQQKIGEYECQLKTCKATVNEWRKKSEWCNQKFAEMEEDFKKQLECRDEKIVSLENELNEADETCNRKLTEMEDFKKQLECRDKKIVSLENELNEMDELCNKKIAAMDEDLKKQLECREKRIVSLENELNESDKVCNKKLTALENDFKKQLDCCEKKVVSLENELNEIDEVCNKKIAAMDEDLKKQLDCRDKKIVSLENELNEMDELCNKKIAAMDEDLKKQLECREKKIVSLENELNAIDEACNKKLTEMEDKYVKQLESRCMKIALLEEELKKEHDCCKTCSEQENKYKGELDRCLNKIESLEAELENNKASNKNSSEMEAKFKEELDRSCKKIKNLEAELEKKELSLQKVLEVEAKYKEELDRSCKTIAHLDDELEKTQKSNKKCTEMVNKFKAELEFNDKKIAILEDELKKQEGSDELVKDLECCRKKIANFEAELECSRKKIANLEAEMKKNDELISTLSNEVLKSETKIKDLQGQLQRSQDEIDSLHKELQNTRCKREDFEETQSSYANEVQALHQQIQCTEARLTDLSRERDSLLKSNEDCASEVKELKKNTKRLENANYCLAKEIAAEVERLKVDLMVKLHNFCPLITSLEMTRTELQEALALFEDAERRCCSLNEKLNQTNEELQALKAMKQSASKASKLLHNCSEKSLENQVLLADACEDLSSLNSEKLHLKSAVDSLMTENEKKDRLLCEALHEMEELRREINHLKNESEDKCGMSHK